MQWDDDDGDDDLQTLYQAAEQGCAEFLFFFKFFYPRWLLGNKSDSGRARGEG